MSKRYKKAQVFQKCPKRSKNDEMSKESEKKKKVKKIKRRLRLDKRLRSSNYREEKKCFIPGKDLQTDMVYEKNYSFEDENIIMNHLILKGKIRKNDEIKEKNIYLEKSNKNDNKMKLKNIIIIIKLFVIIDLIPILPSNKWFSIEYNLSKITLKIKGKGIKNIFGFESPFYCFKKDYFPNEVYINGELQNEVKYSYNFNQTDNFVDLIWNNNINSSYYMFWGCSNIIEFDFSNFDTSKISSMNSMFSGCSLLTSLNLSNFNTLSTQIMSNMFSGCIIKFIKFI